MRFLKKGLSFILAGLVFFTVLLSSQLNSSSIQSVVAQESSVIAQIPAVSLSQLPPQVQTTLTLIDKGGPFPYPQKDGTVFSNREGILPKKPKGYYREYTVPTPGATNRGARRLVMGSNGEIYYTNNHYQSFVRVLRR
jgi:guanyl-specific ribonuclease Sa